MKLTTLHIYAISILLFGSVTESSLAAYYDTLPKGVRLLAFRQVQTSDIENEFSKEGRRESLSFNQSLTSKELSEIKGADIYFDELKKTSPAAYEMFRVGRYEIDTHAQLQVQGFGVAYGLTERLTTFVSIPYYRASVLMDVKRTESNNYQDVANQLNQSGQESDTAYLLNQLTSQLPDADGQLLQTVLVRNYEYKPIGSWNAKGLGDVELTGLYRLTDWKSSGLATSFGVTLPTGRVNDPDILQDMAFGDGQTDLFLEFGGGISIMERKLDLDASLRYTYQIESHKTLRIPESEKMQFSSEKGEFNEKLGNMWNSDLMVSYKTHSWLQFQAGHEFLFEGSPNYSSPYQEANQILGLRSGESYHIIKTGLKLSTVELYQMAKFSMPMSVQLLARKTVTGRNTPEVSRVDLEFRLFF